MTKKNGVSRLLFIFLISSMLVLTGPGQQYRAEAVPNAFTKAHITSFNDGVVDVVDLTTNTVEKAKITVGSGPNSAAINPDGTQVFVTNRNDGTVSVIDPANDTVTETITVGMLPHGIAFSPDGSKAYVANYTSNSLSVINTETLTVAKTILVGIRPVAMVTIGEKLYLTLMGANKVSIVDIPSDTVAGEIAVGNSPYGLSVNAEGTKIYVANSADENVSVIKVADNTVEATIDVGSSPTATEVAPDGSRVYVANSASHSVSVIDTTNNTVVATISVGSSPFVIGVSQDGSQAYTVNYGSNDMSVIDTTTNEVVQTLGLSNGPFMVGTFMVPTAVAVAAEEGGAEPSDATAIDITDNDIVHRVANGGADYTGSEQSGQPYTGNSVTVRIGNTVGQLKQAIAATDSSNQSYSVTDINNGAKSDSDALAIGDKLIVMAENSQDTATYKVWTTIAVEELTDWNLVETMYGTALTDPDDDLGSGGTNELVKLSVSNDEEQLFFRVNVKDFYNGKSNLGLALSTSADGSTLDGMVWLEFDVNKSDNQILVTKATVDKINGNQAASTDFYSSERIHTSPSIQQPGTTSVVVAVPFSVFSQANLAGVNNNNIVPIWAQSNASQQSTAQWKDKIPDQGFFNYNTSGGTWQQETGLDPTTNMSFDLSQPDKTDAGNDITVNQDAPKTVTVNVINGTETVVITGTKAGPQSVEVIGEEADKVTPGGTSTDPTYTVNTSAIASTGGVYIFGLRVSEDGKSEIEYEVNVTVAAVTVGASPAKAITAFNFAALDPDVIGVVNEGAKTIALTVPFGTDVTTLVPTIVHAGASVSPNTGAAQNFTAPVTYTVTAADASEQDYVVTVTEVPTYSVSLSPTGDITFDSKVAGYTPVAVETISITKTGNQNITNLAVALGGATPVSFTLSDLGATTLDGDTTSTSFTVKPNDGLAAGTYTATVTITGDNGISESFNVSFTVTIAPAITSVSISPETASLVQGTTQQLTATVVTVGGAAETVTWSTSDTEGKVTVNDTGLVTVAADAEPGVYTITATSTVDGTKTGTSIVTVAPVAITAVGSTDGAGTVTVSGATPGATVTLYDSNGDNIETGTIGEDGSYIFTNVAVGEGYQVTQTVNNIESEKSPGVIVGALIDTTKPIITLIGDAEVRIIEGTTYNDAGATATDNIDGDITGDIVIDNPVNTEVPGIYTVTYNVSDAAGNPAEQVTRTVTVAPTTVKATSNAVEGTVTVTGGKPGETVTLYDTDGSTVLAIGTLDQNGNYTFTGVTVIGGEEYKVTQTINEVESELSLTDEEEIGDTLRNLNVGYKESGDTWESVTDNLFLIRLDSHETNVEWTSSHPSVVMIPTEENQEIEAVITRQQTDTSVIVTARVSKEGTDISKRRTFLLIVKASTVTKATNQEEDRFINLADQNVLITRVIVTDTADLENTTISTIDKVILSDGAATSVAASAINNLATVSITKNSDDIADEYAIELPRSAVATIAGADDQNRSLKISNDYAQFTIGASHLQTMKENNLDLFFRIVPIKEATQKQQVKDAVIGEALIQAEVQNNKTVVTLGTPLKIETNYSGYETDLIIPFAENDITIPTQNQTTFINSLAVFIEHNDEKILRKVGEQGTIIVYDNGQPFGISVKVSKFSTFTIVELKEPAPPSGGGSGGGVGTVTPPSQTIKINVETGSIIGASILSSEDITRTTQPDGTKKDAVTLTSETMAETIEKLKEADQSVARLVIPDASDEVSEITVSTPKAIADSLAKEMVDLEIHTEHGRITIPYSSLEGLPGDFYFRIIPIKELDKRKMVEEQAKTEQITKAISDGSNIVLVERPYTIETNMPSRPVKVTLPLKDTILPSGQIERDNYLKNMYIFIQHTDGDKVIISGQLVQYDNKGLHGLEFDISKFSTFAIINMATEITSCTIPEQVSPTIIDVLTGTVELEIPVGTDLSNLIASFDLSPGATATVNGVPQISGVTANDFTKPVTYLITGQDGSTKEWIITVTHVSLTSGKPISQENFHKAYISGYPDGTFKAENSIKRAEMAAILARVIEHDITTVGTSYPDTSDHWAHRVIEIVTQLGIMSGYPDGTFRPENTITRAEMATVIANWQGLQKITDSLFSDIDGHWGQYNIRKVNAAGIMQGYPDGTFQPDRPLSRAEAVTVINKILGRGPLYGMESSIWPDVDMSHWAFHNIEEASQDHYYEIRPEGGELIKK